MADQKVSDLPSLNGVDVDPADLLYIVDSSAGTAGSKKITIGQFQLSPWSAGTVNGVVYFDGSKVPASGSALTFDGTNLGIGTISPASKLHVSNTAAATRITITDDVANGRSGYIESNFSDALVIGTTSGVRGIRFSPDNTPRMFLDTSGNLGIGTSSPNQKLEVRGTVRAGLQTSSINGTVLLDDSYNGIESLVSVNTLRSTGGLLLGAGVMQQENSSNIVSTTNISLAKAGLFLDTGAFVFKNAAAAAVARGTTVSLTTLMTLDASGNLGLGVTPSAWLSSQKALEVSAWSVNASTITSSLATNAYVNASSQWIYKTNAYATRYDNVAGAHQFFTAPSGTAGTAITFTQAMTLDASGNLLIGTSSNVNNYKTHILTSDTAAAVGIFQNNPTTPYGMNIYYGSAAPNNSNANTSFLYCNDISTVRIQLASNGGVINYQANNSNLSDRREKKDFAPAKSYLNTICSIPVQTFKYIDQTDDVPTLGVVAQDVQAVAPELVMESNWGAEDEPKMRLSIYQTDLQYALMKSIQELKAALDAANARIAKLEAK